MLSDRQPPASFSGIACSVDTLLKALPDSEAAALRGMLTDRRWTNEGIYRACVEEGHSVGRQTIQRHRAGTCRCKP